MRKWIAALVFSCVVAMAWLAPASAASILADGINEMTFDCYENLYDANGNYLPPGTPMMPGHHLVGILNVTGIKSGGRTIFYPSPARQLTGVFAQSITEVQYPDPYGDARPRFVLGPATVTTFTKDDGTAKDSFSTGLQPGEMFRFFLSRGRSTPPEYVGTLAENVRDASDGELLMSLGTGATGYVYGNSSFGFPLPDISGNSFGGLVDLVNNSGKVLGLVKDPSANEVNSYVNVYVDAMLKPNSEPRSRWILQTIGTATMNAVKDAPHR